MKTSEIKKTEKIVQKFSDFYYSLPEEKQRRVNDFIEGTNFAMSLRREAAVKENKDAESQSTND